MGGEELNGAGMGTPNVSEAVALRKPALSRAWLPTATCAYIARVRRLDGPDNRAPRSWLSPNPPSPGGRAVRRCKQNDLLCRHLAVD